MNHDRDIERVLGRWLIDGVDVMPDRVLLAVLDQVEREGQRVTPRLLRRRPTRTAILRLAAAAVAVMVIVVGTNLARSTPSGVGVPGPTTSPAPTTAPTPTSTPVPSPSAGVAGACDLITAAEAANALHSSSAVVAQSLIYDDTTAVTNGPSALCWFHTGGSASLFLLVYNKDNGGDTFAIWKRATGLQPVSGLGDDATWDPRQTTLYILKGDRLVTIEPVDGPDPTLTREVTTAIGAIVAKRM